MLHVCSVCYSTRANARSPSGDEYLRAFLPAFVHVADTVGADKDLAEWCRKAFPRLRPFEVRPVPFNRITRIGENGRRVYDNPFFFGEQARDDDEVLAVG